MASTEDENTEDLIQEFSGRKKEKPGNSSRRDADNEKRNKGKKARKSSKWGASKGFNRSEDEDEDDDSKRNGKLTERNKDYPSDKIETAKRRPKAKLRNDITIDMSNEEEEENEEEEDEKQDEGEQDENRAPGKNKKKKNKRFFKTRNSPRHLFSPKAREDFEESKLWKKIGILDGKDKMMWARRAFFMSTEQIFPGFTRNYGLSSKSRDPAGIKLRSSVPLKICLLAHSYFVPLWFLGFVATYEFSTRSLKPLHSYVHTCITYISMGTDLLRLYAGFLSNTKDDMQLLALYWMATVILQTPMLCFIFATHTFSTWLLPLNVSLDTLLGCILILEIWFGFWHLKGLVSSEINLLYMARQMHDVVLVKDSSHKRTNNPRVINCPDRGPYVDWSSSSSSSSSGGSVQAKTKSSKKNNKSVKVKGSKVRGKESVLINSSDEDPPATP
jgi:hypothetical protein